MIRKKLKKNRRLCDCPTCGKVMEARFGATKVLFRCDCGTVVYQKKTKGESV